MAVIVNGVDIVKKFNNYLAKDNTEPYTPTGPYEPVTKEYADNIASGSIGNASQVYIQSTPEKTWIIENNTSKECPTVTIIDSANSVVYGDIEYDRGTKSIIIRFSAPFSGRAYID